MYICCDKLIEAEYEANFVGYALGLMIRTTDKKEKSEEGFIFKRLPKQREANANNQLILLIPTYLGTFRLKHMHK